MSVSNVMTRDVVTVQASCKAKDALLMLMARGISGVPVVDSSGGLVGILSVTDIFRAVLDRVVKARSLREATTQIIDKEMAERDELRELSLAIRAVAESPVSMIVPKGQLILSLKPGDSLDRTIRMMAENSVNRLPVMKDGKVIGIITRQDVIEVVAGVVRKGQASSPSREQVDV